MPSVNDSQIESQSFQGFFDSLALVLPHESVIDVDGVDLVGFKGLVQQGGADGRVDATADEQQDFVGTDEALDLLDAPNLPSVHGEARGDGSDAHQKILQHRFPVDAQIYFRVELQAVQALRGVSKRSALESMANRAGLTRCSYADVLFFRAAVSSQKMNSDRTQGRIIDQTV